MAHKVIIQIDEFRNAVEEVVIADFLMECTGLAKRLDEMYSCITLNFLIEHSSTLLKIICIATFRWQEREVVTVILKPNNAEKLIYHKRLDSIKEVERRDLWEKVLLPSMTSVLEDIKTEVEALLKGRNEDKTLY